MTKAPTICGFEFKVRERGRVRWCRLMGSGGLLGDGALAALNAPDRWRRRRATTREELLGRVRRKLLAEARRQVEVRGDVLALVSWDLPPAERFEAVVPTAILEVREVVPCS